MADVTLGRGGHVFLALALTLAGAILASRASGLVVVSQRGAENKTRPSDDPGWSNVGMVWSLTGTYLGNGWMLTASHVGAGPVVLGNHSFHAVPDSTVQLKNPDGSLADVIAFRPDSLRETGRVAGASTDLWLFTTWRSRTALPLASDADTTSVAPVGMDSLAGAGPLYVQVSISQNESWSTEMAQQLARAGLEAKVLPPKTTDDGYRVVLGPYPNRGQAETIGRKLGRPYWIYQP